MLTQSQRNDRREILCALAARDVGDPFVRAVVAEMQQIDRRACEQIAFLGTVPEVITMPPIGDEIADIALSLWAGDSPCVVSPEVQLEIATSCCGRVVISAPWTVPSAPLPS